MSTARSASCWNSVTCVPTCLHSSIVLRRNDKMAIDRSSIACYFLFAKANDVHRYLYLTDNVHASINPS